MENPPSPISATPAAVNQLLKAAFLAALGLGFASLFTVILKYVVHDPAEGWYGIFSFGLALLVAGILLILAGFRRLFLVLTKPSLRLSPEAIAACVPSRKLFPGVFLFRHRMQNYVIPWTDFLGTQTYTHSVNLIPVTRELWIKNRQGILKIDSSLFMGSPKKLQSWLLDFFEDLRRSAQES